jgi:hypothetical protein
MIVPTHANTALTRDEQILRQKILVRNQSCLLLMLAACGNICRGPDGNWESSARATTQRPALNETA